MNNIIKQIVESKFNFNIDVESNNVNLSKNTHISRTQKDSYMDLLFSFNFIYKHLIQLLLYFDY